MDMVHWFIFMYVVYYCPMLYTQYLQIYKWSIEQFKWNKSVTLLESHAARDIVFLVDTSKNVPRYNLQIVIDFINSIIEKIQVGKLCFDCAPKIQLYELTIRNACIQLYIS